MAKNRRQSKKMTKKKGDPSGLFIPAGLFIGFAVGFLVDNVPVGMFGGLGLGFLIFAIIQMKKK